MEAFLIVGTKVGVMAMLILTGMVIAKLGRVTEKGNSDLTWILLNIVTPCVIIDAFAQLETGELPAESLGMGVLVASLAIATGFLISPLLFRKQEKEKRKVLRCASILSNTGFMGVPLTSAVLGYQGVIFASIYVAIFNFAVWTAGYAMISGERTVKVKKIFLNPGTIGIFIGLLIYFSGIKLPVIISEPITALSLLNMPLAMLILGYFMAKVDFRAIIKEVSIYKVAFFKLVMIPMIVLGLLALIRPEYNLFMSAAIQSCTPTATTTVLFAAMVKADAKMASLIVVATTIFSLITVPLFVMLAQIIAQNIL